MPPTNCSVSNLTINGAPNVSVATQINFAASQVQFPVTATEGGGISYGPNPSGSCTVNVSLTLNSLTSCTVTGRCVDNRLAEVASGATAQPRPSHQT